MTTLNEVFTRAAMRRRYEVWFMRLGLADGSGAWWFRYLLMNPGRGGCAGDAQGQPVQVWATWFPREGKPETWIEGFPLAALGANGEGWSRRGASPFSLAAGENRITESECHGRLEVRGQKISWELRYRSTFRVELSSKGWIGFSRTPHSDAICSGEIRLNEQVFRGEPLGYGLQGHNCGYRHRNWWTWAHVHLPGATGPGTTFEALCYEMPLGMKFQKAVLWHEGKAWNFSRLREISRDREKLEWKLQAEDRNGALLELSIRGREGRVRRLPYVKTDCSGRFEVTNDSLAVAQLILRRPGKAAEEWATENGAVLEMVGK